MSADGRKIVTRKEWEKIRRPEILELLTQQMYGIMPSEPFHTSYRILEESEKALGGKATRKQIEITFRKKEREHKVIMLLYLPNAVKDKAPVFFVYNFWGNQVICKDPAIIPTSERENGCRTNRWPVPMIIDSGYGIATIDYTWIYPDNREAKTSGRHKSVLTLFSDKNEAGLDGNECQAIGAWAWGMSRAMDYFEKDRDIDASRVIIMGHSRLGKTALWAGAQDKRFSIVISNESGCGGAKLSKRDFGQTVLSVTTNFPHWFCKNFSRYADREQELPFDQHFVISMIAPRPVYVASAAEDLWSDPQGEFLAAMHAGEVYRLYGFKGLETEICPAAGHPIMNRVGYHIRNGKHDVTEEDWKNYIRFADLWSGKQ